MSIYHCDGCQVTRDADPHGCHATTKGAVCDQCHEDAISLLEDSLVPLTDDPFGQAEAMYPDEMARRPLSRPEMP